MSECYLCKQGDPSIPVRCWWCLRHFHLHRSQIDAAPEGATIIGDCPRCGVTNCWQKVGDTVVYSGPVIYQGEPILDLRGK